MRPVSVHSRVIGKWQAASTMCWFARLLTNWRAVWSRYRLGQPVPSPLRLRNGLTLEFTPHDDPIQLLRELFAHRVYTPAWFYRVRPGHLIVDVGANLGWFAISQASQVEQVAVHCYEPAPASRAILARNVKINKLAQTVHVYHEAVAQNSGTAILLGGKNSLHRSFFANAFTTETGSEEVPTISLEEALRRTGVQQVDLLKVDAEGGEKLIFSSLTLESLARVARVTVEFHDHFCPGARATVERALRDSGFSGIRVSHVCHDGTNGILYAWRG